MIFGGDLQECRKGLLIFVYSWSDLLCDMLIDQEDCNVLTFCELLKRSFNRGYLRFGIYDEEIFLLILNVSYACKEEPGD